LRLYFGLIGGCAVAQAIRRRRPEQRFVVREFACVISLACHTGRLKVAYGNIYAKPNIISAREFFYKKTNEEE
jgi:hypothetical protein